MYRIGFLIVFSLLVLPLTAEEVAVVSIAQDTWIEQGVGDSSGDFELQMQIVNGLPTRQALLKWDADFRILQFFDVQQAYIVVYNTAYNPTAMGADNTLSCYRLTDKHMWDDSWTFLDFGGMLSTVNGDRESQVAVGQQIIPGDANLDGEVDGDDLDIIIQNLWQSDRGWTHGDFNGDGFVDGSDFNLWALHVGETVPNYPAAVTIIDVMGHMAAYAADEPQNGMQLQPIGGFWRIASSELDFLPPPELYIHFEF